MLLQRARPWLGTLVEMHVDGLAAAPAERAIEAAFAEVARIHACMSFHTPDSDLSRLHRSPLGRVVDIDERTGAVLAAACMFAEVSRGRFDPSVAADLVAWDFLPKPDSPFTPDPACDWRDIDLLDTTHVRLRRPLWIDLGGIAKGYAVDRALGLLRAAGATAATVNAGGDLALFGARTHTVEVRLPAQPQQLLPLLELRDGAVASSAGYFARRRVGRRWLGPHVHGTQRRAIGTHGAVSVVAPTCLHADALTKIVLADPRFAAGLLARFDAQACVYEPRRGWRTLARS